MTLAKLPRAVVVDVTKIGEGLPEAATNDAIDGAAIGAWIKSQYPGAMMIVQSSELPAIEGSEKFVVAWLDRNARTQGQPDESQDQTLKQAHLVVTDSEETAAAYWDFDFQIVPSASGAPEAASQGWARLLQRARLRIDAAKVRQRSVEDLKPKRFYVVKPRPWPLRLLDRVRRSLPRIKPFRRWPGVARVYLLLGR